MGIVYKAHDASLDRVVALKFLPGYLTSDPIEKERFYHEARAASSLNHPNITVIHEIAEYEGQLLMAMEYIEGRTLKYLVQHDPPQVKKALDIAIQVCDGLSAAEEKKIVHRDIKSDNIMLTPKGQVKIMDFGLAKVKGASKLTRAGSTLGTAAYMSPEQAQGEEVDHRSDIFSFGVVLYELLTANLPFRGEHQAAMMYSLINEDPPPIPRFNTAVSPELERIVAKALAKDREERYQHVDDLLADLRRERKNFEYARAGYVRSTASQPVVAPAAPKRRYKTLILAAAAVVAVILVLVFFNPFNFQISTQRTVAAGPGQTSLAVLYFQNIADPQDKDHVGDMLADLLITALSQSRDIEVISRERLYDIQKELKADAKVISPDMASKVAQRAGVTTMLLGSIVQMEPELMVTTRLIDVQSGKIINSQRIAGYRQKQIFGLVDTLALLIRKELAGTAPAPGEQKSVAEVTTNSPEAYRSYVEAEELNKKFFYAEAHAAYRHAIELDSNFAMAYFGLATASGELDDAVRAEAIKKAWSLRENVTEVERLVIESVYTNQVEHDAAKATGILETMVEKYPKTLSAYLALSLSYSFLDEFEKTTDILRRGLRVDSLDKSLWNNYTYACALIGDKGGALEANSRYMSLAPAEPNPYDSRGDVAMMFGDADSAVWWWRKALSFRQDFASSAKLAMQALLHGDVASSEKLFSEYAATQVGHEKEFSEEAAMLPLLWKGELRKARARNLEVLTSHLAKHVEFLTNFDYATLFWIAYELGDAPAMLEYAGKRSAELKKSRSTQIYGRDLVAVATARAGNGGAAEKLLEELDHDVRPTPKGNRPPLPYVAALILLEQGKNAAALAKFQESFRGLSPNHAPLYFYALCLLRAGKDDEAINEFRRVAASTPINQPIYDIDFFPTANYWPVSSVKAHYWLGVAYERQGKKEQAAAEYRQFVQTWGGADFPSRELDDAKARLAALRGTASR